MADKIIKGQFMYAVTNCGIIEVSIRTVTDNYFVGTDLETSQAIAFTYDNVDKVVFQDREAALSAYKAVKHDDR